MPPIVSTPQPSRLFLSVPAMIELLDIIHLSARSDVVLANVSTTLQQAIDELTALRGAALDVFREVEPRPLGARRRSKPTLNRRRLC